ncbi:unnamed protein product [Triticum turgidum subsp. durum]|uniref:Uncharacterized protein n=1 Tax=Triticum turgidum subsp. durum TaxID=4567 RepID=A0A9R0QPT9_TRITD|nr:unnamed protein product [Triticum turgidum subsp. durum]
MAPSVPRKKRKVSLPKNEEVTARIFEKHRSMAAQQPAGLPDHQARALCAAYTGVCAAKEPVRTPGDLARLKCAFPRLSRTVSSYAIETSLAQTTVGILGMMVTVTLDGIA